jgi:hypothetical protein
MVELPLSGDEPSSARENGVVLGMKTQIPICIYFEIATPPIRAERNSCLYFNQKAKSAQQP